MSAYRNPSYPRTGLPSASSDSWLSLLLYYILPFIIVNGILFVCITSKPKCTITVADTNDYLSTEVTLKVDSWFPTKSVSLFIDSEEIELEKGSRRTYKAVIYKNGSVEANIVNVNGMPLTQFESVDVLDDNPPSVGDPSVEDGVVTLTFGDSQSGVNAESIYALNSAGQALSPLALEESAATAGSPRTVSAAFEMDPDGIQVFAQDTAGNTVQRTLTPYKVGEEDTITVGEEGAAEMDEEGTAPETEESTDSGQESSGAKKTGQATKSHTY